MILQALYELADREHLMDDPDYEWKPVPWLIKISRDGRILGFVDTRSAPPDTASQKQGGKVTRRKPKAVAQRYKMPREKSKTSGDCAFFLYDNATYVFKKDPTGGKGGHLQNRFGLFRKRVDECLKATGDEGVESVAKLLERVDNGEDIKLPEEANSTDLFSFVYEPDIDRLVTDRPAVRAYWQRLRAAPVAGALTRNCLVSGQEFQGGVINFPPTKKVPGGTTSGVPLVSFNKSAFESYGWSGNENAPISRKAAESCSTALNRLLDPSARDANGQTLPKRSLHISSDTAVCFWSARESGDLFCDVFASLVEVRPEEVGELYQSVWRGKLSVPEDESAFYALVISGTQGRAIVRDWIESTVHRVAANLAQHFEDLRIVRNTPPPKESGLPPQLALGLLLRSLSPDGDRKKVPPPLVGELVTATLRGTAYPFSLLQRALERERSEVGRHDWDDENRRDARAAIIKAVLNRRRRFFPDISQHKEVQPDMDPTNTSEGYLLGQTMAVLERIQQAAQPNINATIVDRYFGGASAAPRSVFVRLFKNARHHVTKAKDEDQTAGLIFRLEKLLDNLADHFDVKSNGFPAYLNLNQQGLFVLGYHQMRKWLWMGREEREAWETKYTDAPQAYLWGKK